MTKQEARIYCRKKRLEIGPAEREKMQDMMLIRFQQMQIPFIHVLHTYMPAQGKGEADPDSLVRLLVFRNPGLQVAVPRISPDGRMDNVLLQDDTEWTLNGFGIPEPVSGVLADPLQIDLALVPLLGFDMLGNRVGYGKGYYDRFLEQCRNDMIIIGLSFLDALPKIEDPDPWDVPLDYCITPNRVYEF